MQSNQSSWKLLGPINELCKHNRKCAAKLQRFLPKQIWTKAERDEVLNALSDLFLLGGDCVVDLCIWFGPLILEIVSRLTQSILREGHSGQRLLKKMAVVMCKGFPISSVLQRFAVDFVHLYKPFTLKDTSDSDEPPRKRAKKNQISDLDWCHAMWSYMVYLPETVDKLGMERLDDYLSSTDGLVRWYASCALSKYYAMSESETAAFLKKYFTPDEQRTFTIRVDKEVLALQERLHKAEGSVEVESVDATQSHTLQAITSADLTSQVVSVMGSLLPKIGQTSESDSQIFSPLVLVPSTQQHLRSLAVAVSCCRPVLLQGPVGCGKTSLVEHLAMLTGRHGFPEILKIQLGDQTDSKALLGTYCSTEVPGEFVWRAGVLTQAVSRGSWVLLEDVDTAPMDVLSLLVALAETRTLMVPGHGDEIRAAPGFQLFTTQRLLSSSDGWHHLRGGNSQLLEKLCTVINVEPLSRTELNHVIAVRFPALVPVSDKLLDIYFMLSAGRHDVEELAPQVESQPTRGKFLSTGGRQISTRDLMTWCSRSSVGFDHKESSQGLRVFLEAVDCFVSCIPKQTTRLSLACAVGEKLNVTEDRSKYFCTDYKPSLRDSTNALEIGRAKVQRQSLALSSLTARPAPTFSYTRSSLVLLEKVAVCVNRNEPVLLAGETGTGKTSTVQFLAHYLGHKLHVINLNQQSDSTDLLGGFKPVDLKFVMMPLREEFEMLFCESFSRAQNEKFLSHVQTLFSKKRWNDLLTLIEAPTKKAVNKFDTGTPDKDRWAKLLKRIHELRLQIREMENVLAFSFIEGTLVKALRKGDWILLDEINLATAETLECLSGLLESSSGSVVLTERGDSEPIQRHPDFRLFACMNPATDVGKKDLPVGIRNRFTEFYVEELECPKDLSILVRDYLPGLSLTSKQVTAIVNFYLCIKNDPSDRLMDGTGHRPHFSLRTLCRALMFCARNPCRSVPRSMFEGFSLSFLTQLDRSSHPVVQDLIIKHILANSASKAVLGQKLPKPEGEDGAFVQAADYWISRGTLEPAVPTDYILTPSVKLNLKDLARVVSAGKHAVLLQGETSVGKTSLITYLAQLTGNVCLRVNNHEHTDIQEYVGSYAADEHGKLVFKEGVLVEAMRKGYWIILDELNLAPTDVLEALNRLLDDNQELYIPETQEMVQAHPKFMLFATQNPPGLYGGRKVLSRAFRNRFIELHFDEIPAPELETILHQRCGIPLSYAKKLVAVMLELQMRRRGSGIFSGKHGFMTLRDLFRWAQRYNCPEAGKGEKFYDWDQHLAEHGYMLLAGRVRKPEEEVVIKEVIEKHLKRKLQIDALYTILPQTSAPLAAMLNSVVSQSLPGFQHIVWTHSMRRLAVLIGQAMRFKEPILLVGDTGVGKTTVCQLYAALQGRTLLSINCHMHTESADFLGGLRPVRSQDDDSKKENMLFEWKDGPLVIAMKEGAMFLIDEISLADDSVLERLNSVLEPERTILLAERASGGEAEVEKLQAAEHFQVFATMNPGGDFGKKELSPALRNRFTEIWCPQSHDRADLIAVIEKNIHPGLHLYNTQDGMSGFGHAILEFVEWFLSSEMGRRVTVSIRDILSWVGFINTCAVSQGNPTQDADAMETDDVSQCSLDSVVAYVHGACLVFIDSLGAGSTTFITETNAQASRLVCLSFLQEQLSTLLGHDFDLNQCQILLPGDSEKKMVVVVTEQTLSIPPFHISREPVPDTSVEKFALQAPTTCVNGQRLLRALQLPRPVLLEGSPGVGKTSLVAAIARMARKTLVRINLSEQTDVTDLFGADLPVEGQEGGHFAWRDGPFLQALKAGHWVVFDELNLASQSVLEGLNACFDHRAEVYIPELGKTFHIHHEKTRIFACQNPLSQGGGRKGLPRSFLNRFTQVYVDPLTRSDLLFITTALYPGFPEDMLLTMVDFNSKMQECTMVQKTFGGKGAPWEFNLRDLFRWCDLLQANQGVDNLNPGEYVGLVYKDRMRTAGDKIKVDELYLATFEQKYPLYSSSRKLHIGHSLVQAGHSFLPRGGCEDAIDSHSAGKSLCLHHSLEPLESLMKCVEMGWLTILVGPQSSGKTSLVKLLSKLTGRALCVVPMNSSMDTTELLGGFEQSDVWRHLGLITALLQAEVRNLGKRFLLEKDSKESSFLSLVQAWAKYRTLATTTEGLSCVDVAALFSQHLKQLRMIISHLENIGHSLPDRLSEVQLLLSQLSTTVSNMKPAGGGGAFEWMDSMLVKALKNGDWLLIDNVNFCSASVLDRLNALLEPKGVLSINERGSVNGEIATVVPHPEFRLFFAMDPRYGDISRAMRNRGIEIYLLGEDDGCAYSQPDICCMLEAAGLNDKRVCQWWLELHTALKSELPFGDRPVIADLLHVGTLCVQLMNRGFSLRHAFAYAAEDGYVGNKRNAAAKQLARNIVSRHLEAVPEHLSDAPIACIDVQAVAKPWVGEARYLANVKRDAKLILSTLERLSHNPSGTMTPACRVELHTAVLIFTSLQSELSWKLAQEWTEAVIPTVEPNLAAVASIEQDVHNVKFLLDNWKTLVSDCLKQVFTGSTWADLTRTLEAVFASSPKALTLLKEQPWDLTLNPQASQHAALIHERELGRTLQTEQALALNNVQKHISRLQLIQICVVLAHNLKDKMSALEETISKGKKKASAIQPLGLVSLLLSHVTEELPQLLESLEDDHLAYLVEAPYNLLWIVRLVDVALTWQSLHRDVFIAHLALHWHWVADRLRCLLTQAQHHNPKIAMVMGELQRHLGGGDKSVKMHVKFWTTIGHPRPFTSEAEAAVAQSLAQITSALTLCSSDSQVTLKRKVDAFTRSGLSCQGHVQDVMAFIASGDLSEAEKAIQVLASSLTRNGFMQACRTAPSMSENEADNLADAVKTVKDTLEGRKTPSQFVSLWPLFGHMSLLADMSALSSQFLQHAAVTPVDASSMAVVDSEPVEVSKMAPLRDFVISHLPELTNWSLSGRDFSNGNFLGEMQRLFSRLWSSPTCYRHQQWLKWSDHQDELRAPVEDMGPGVLHSAPVCRFAMHILSKNSQITNTVDLLPLQVSLGNLQEQTQEVSLMSRHVWCHSSALASPQYDIRFLEKKLLHQSFMKLMCAMQSLLAPNYQSDWSAALKDLQAACHFTGQSFGECQNILSCSLDSFPSHISALLPRCLEVVHDALRETSPDRLVPLVGHGLVYVGLLLAHFLSPKGPIDPVEKNRLKLGHIDKELEELEAELSTWNQHLLMRTGRDISQTHANHLHPRVLAQLQRRDKLKTSRRQLEQCAAYRPDMIQYIQLSQAISSFMESSCSVSKVSDLVRRLNIASSWSSNHHGDVTLTAALQEERVWQDTTERFIQRLMSSFQCYMDIVVPFCVGVQEMKLGLRLLAQNSHKTLKMRKLGPCQNITSLVGTLCSFPTVKQTLPDLLSLANQMSSSSIQDAVVSVLLSSSAGDDVGEVVRATKSRLLLCALLLLKAHSFISRRLDGNFIATLSSILDLFTSAWAEQEERRKQKEAEDSALFKYKEQIHGDERSENEKEEADFRAAYPSFEQDFIDVTGAVRLEDVGLQKGHEDPADGSRMHSLDCISPKEMAQVCSAHSEILITLSQADWLERNPSDYAADVLTPALMSYQIGTTVVRTAFDVLDPEADGQVLGSHLLVGGSVLQYLELQDGCSVMQNVLKKPSGKSYNIYYDANVPEVMKCKAVIDSLRKRVGELQKEWPDHPTLVLLNQIMDRILSFSVTSPVVKFLTGLELLLQKAQDWEGNAASYVSMATQLSEITSVIVSWRKLELSCWSSALDREEEKSKEKASHWWFHLFQVTSAFVSSDPLPDSKDTDKASVLDSLKKFMETSTMGEYSFRLQMLLAFHCQLLHMNSSPAQKHLVHVLWNIYQFYKQYQPSVEAEIKRLRLPIDKQLKGFVKIARWSDLNYWALKSSTEKTHRTVHKYIKEYQAVLRQPAKNMLGDKGDDLVVQAVKQVSGFPLEEQFTLFTQCVTGSLRSAQVDESCMFKLPSAISSDIPLLFRMPSLFKKMKKHLVKCVAETRHAKRILVFDDFTGELIQEIHELQGLQVDMSAEKDKQKSQARSFNLMKRKSLADLFKCLSEIGLSYRKGVSGKAGRGFRDALELPPLNLQAHPELPVSKLWSGCETYFYRCISRYAQFSAAVVSPSKELTMADIERIRGFIEHFSQLYIEQRDRLSSLTSSFLSLNKMLVSVRSLEKSSSCSIPPQSESRSWLAQTKQLTTQLSEGMLQFQLLLESCPSDHQGLSLVNVHPSPLPVSKLAPSALWSRGDSAWTQCYETLEMMMKSVRDEQAVIDKLLNESILARSDLETVAKVLDTYKCLTSQLAEVSSHFTKNSPGDKCCLVSTLSYLCSEISCLHEGFHLWYNKIQAKPCVASSETAADGSMQDSPSAFSDEFLRKTESFVEALLLGVQNVVKMRQLSAQDTARDDDAGEKSEDQEDDLQEAHLTKHLLDLEKNVITNLGCDQIIAKLEDLICSLCRQSDEASSSSGQTPTAASTFTESLAVDCKSLLQSVPLASAFSSLVESQLGLSVALHRSMGKLLSVLLAVFTELSQKGFCIPPELSEEMAGEGATEFKDIEGGGLGEGEGAKDVSDQIESEDQLEDAKQPGQEDKTEDPQDQPDIPSEDNAIEMSDDFDGKLHNKDGTEKEEDNEKDANEDEDMEKQMGEADGEQNDRLDERMWGSDEEEEDENGQDEKDTKEDQGGGGMDKQKEEMVAKDDNKDASEAPDDTQDDIQKDTEEKQQQNELMEDNDDYDDNQVNPHNTEDKEEDAENLDLPTDLNLDDGEKNDKDPGDDDNDVENKDEDDDDEAKKNSDETHEDESEASKEESAEEVEDVQANKLEPQDLDNNEDKSGEDNLQNTKAEKEEEEKEGEGDEGTSGQEEEKPTAELGRDEDDATTSEDKVDTADDAGDVAQHTEAADSLGRGLEQDDTQQDEATRDKQDKAEEKENIGAASSEDQEGHQGQQSSQTSDASASQQQQVQQRNPGQSDNERSLGSHDREHRRLKTQEESRNRNTEEQDIQEEDERRQTAKEYEHIKDARSHYDAQTIDVASKEQMLDRQAVPSQIDNEGDELEDEDDVRMDVEEEEMDTTKHSEKKPAKSTDQDKKVSSEEDAEQAAQEEQKMDVEGERVLTLTADRPPESSVHTLIENLHMDVMPHEVDLDVLRTQLEQCVRTWSHPEDTSLDVTQVALEAWQKYQTITGALSQELCEQLRLILEPSQATKLKGDYRTGKRLNMRKVIPYIASQFRKDKIWLRRSKPSKRQYQILMAIDDSASMADNHSKQLAFESLALVSNALTLLESGELSVCSFGEEVRLLHPFAEPFSNQSGAKILQQLSCEQTQTKYGMLLDKALAMFVEARSRLSAMAGDAETAQLLLILSDGNGVFREGMDVVRRAVRRARAAKIFLVFIVLDNPERKSSILDSRVPIMEPSGEIREIKSYLEMFPFPFYILLRDINSMPQILSDALRQWFELVTSSDR